MAAIFFDTSALVRRYDDTEPGAGRVRTLCRRSARNVLFIAALTPAEMVSAISRKRREGITDDAGRNRMRRMFRLHMRTQYRVLAIDDGIYRHAERLLFRYPLRAYDALQLACALRAAHMLSGLTPEFRFCTADRTQANAAGSEGLSVEFVR